MTETTILKSDNAGKYRIDTYKENGKYWTVITNLRTKGEIRYDWVNGYYAAEGHKSMVKYYERQ